MQSSGGGAEPPSSALCGIKFYRNPIGASTQLRANSRNGFTIESPGSPRGSAWERVLLSAQFAKDRKDATYAVPADLTQSLADNARGRAPEEKLFPPWKQREASREIGRFMKAAGISKKNFHGKATSTACAPLRSIWGSSSVST